MIRRSGIDVALGAAEYGQRERIQHGPIGRRVPRRRDRRRRRAGQPLVEVQAHRPDRAGLGKRRGKPRLSDLRYSGSIEQDADVVMFIHRDDKMNEESDRPNIAEILIEKHRNGPVGKVDLYFNDKQTTFQDLAKADLSAFDGAPF